MIANNEAKVREFLSIFHESSRPDFAKLMTFMANGAQYHTLVPDGKVFVGTNEIRSVLESQFETYNDLACEIHAIASGNGHVFTERTDHVTLLKNGKRITSRVCAVFQLDDNGRITHWREYWDTGNIIDQMGVTREQLTKDIG